MSERAFFYTYETVDLPIAFKNKEVLTDYSSIVISLRHTKTDKQINFTSGFEVDTTEGVILLHLQQEDTAKFEKGIVELQVNILYENSERDVSECAYIDVYDNLYKETM